MRFKKVSRDQPVLPFVDEPAAKPSRPSPSPAAVPVKPKPRKNDWDSLPFGKYSLANGYMLVDVPTDYLEWFLNNVEDRGTGLMEAVEVEYWERPDRDSQRRRK